VKSLVVSTVVAVLAATTAGLPAMAQKSGGTLKMIHRDNAPSGSIHEEATNSVTEPFMGVFNNLVMFDQTKPINSAETIVPDLAKSWEWDATKTKLTFPSHRLTSSARSISSWAKQRIAGARIPGLFGITICRTLP
jgi:peptide/nickel transport system substrate-binding protein